MYFWRTQQQQEVDYVEEKAGSVTGYEFKWNAKKNTKLPKTFIEAYHSKSVIIDKSNFREFVTID